jgi:hypothetical protein
MTTRVPLPAGADDTQDHCGVHWRPFATTELPLFHVRTTAAGESRRPLAPEVSSRAIFLHAGRIEEEGPPNQVFGDPLTERCRAFVARHFNR